MNWLDLFDDNAEADRKLSRESARIELSGRCDDDDVLRCPYIDMMPEESEHENGSPLNFKGSPHPIDMVHSTFNGIGNDHVIDRLIAAAMQRGDL